MRRDWQSRAIVPEPAKRSGATGHVSPGVNCLLLFISPQTAWCAFVRTFRAANRIGHRRCEQEFQRGAAPWHTILVQNPVCCTLIEVYRPSMHKSKSPMPNTLTVRTWDLMLTRPGQILVTHPNRQLLRHFSKTVLRTPNSKAASLPLLRPSMCLQLYKAPAVLPA